MPKQKLLRSRGFTLIELLIVITILAIICIIGFTSYSTVQLVSRDARRKSDLRTIKQALDMYYQINKTYPNPPPPVQSNNGNTPWISGLNGNYISALPMDPNNTGNKVYIYLVHNAATVSNNKVATCDASTLGGYIVTATLENSKDVNLQGTRTFCFCQGNTKTSINIPATTFFVGDEQILLNTVTVPFGQACI